MPTGYTAVIEERDISFKEFALTCARAFGALVEMREEPLSAKISDKLKPSDHYQKTIKTSQEDLAIIRGMLDSEAEESAKVEYLDEMLRVEESLKRRNKHLIRYKKMLAAVHAWVPPTPDHCELKQFMIDQIKISMPRNDEDYYKFPERIDGKRWRANQIQRISDHIACYEREYAAECERVTGRNQWIKALRESLESV